MIYVYTRTRTAQAAIVEKRFVKASGVAGMALQAAAETDPILGVALEFNNPVAGQRCDIAILGPAQLELGGAVNDGDLLTSDNLGRGITATRHAHTENAAAAYAQNASTAAAPAARICAMALAAGNAGDVIDIVVLPQLA